MVLSDCQKFNCIKCGGKHWGMNGDTCPQCLPTNKRVKRPNCSVCGKKHINMRKDDLCAGCRQRESYRTTYCQNARRCAQCNFVLRTNDPRIIRCLRCLDRKDYSKIKR